MSRGSSRASDAYASPHDVPNQRLPAFKPCNVFRLLVRREVSPQSKKSSSKRLWGDVSSKALDDLGSRNDVVEDARQGLISWVEAESLRHLSPKYCPLLPPPRSTIAAAFSPDGKTLASTHGDHTVKIINFQTGNCLKVLSGHRRTPWVVRFHPLHPEILASGSLDNEVRIWDAKTADCIGSRDFFRPIASIAFHAQGEILAVASGHKLFIWVYNRGGETSSPTIILKTCRSLRAVHFHPHGAPFLLTAEVNELKLSDCSTVATPSEYHTAGELSLNTPQQRVYARASVRLMTYSTPSGQYELLLSPIEPNSASRLTEDTGSGSFFREAPAPQSAMNVMETPEIRADERGNHFSSFDPTNWELPFLRGWLMGQNDLHSSSSSTEMGNYAPVASTGRSPSLHRSSRSHAMIIGSGQGVSNSNMTRDESDQQPVGSRIQSELSSSTTAAAAPSPETPCTVKLRIWPHDIKYPCASLEAKRSRLNIPHAVLCSEMGAHFSPCGRFLAACVACMLPHLEADPELENQLMHYDVIRPGTSPTRHPISAHQVVYELRIYSLEEATFGSVLASRGIRAANCLTSIQFSPTSEHLLLAYGRRHSSLLKSIFIDGEMKVPVYTILEVYRLSDMELVRVLSSADDEVNVACFHPLVGGGLVYGTKEGRLRIFQYDTSYGLNYMPSSFPDENPP